jgi:ethanolamine utilization protein EutQ (cupin superfamily)
MFRHGTKFEQEVRTMRVLRLTSADAGDWTRVGDQEIFVNDLIDQAAAPDAKMTVGYARVGKDEALDISFPYDEVLIVTRGAYTVRTEQGGAVTARAGDVIYLPAGSASASRAEEDTEMVYVANPPSVYADHVAQSA